MPKNNDVPHAPLHTKLKFGEPSTFKMVEQLKNIEVKIVDAPSVEQFRKAISVFMMNTWNDKLQYEFDDRDIDNCINELFLGNILPTGQEIIGITWSVSGMDMVDTTHLIRHRLFSFSAQTHADRDMRNDRVVAKASILEHYEFAARFTELNRIALSLYADMMDSGKVNCLDARTVMPRCFEHFYVVRCCIKDLIAFCKMRGDEQIQTQSDNIIAMKLWLEVVKLYPFLKKFVDFRAQDTFYVKQCKEGKTNIFPPNAKNDCFDYNVSQFFHTKHRDSYPGSDVYLELRESLLKQIDEV